MSTSKAQVFVDRNRTIAPISPLLFGGFAEHMGPLRYEGSTIPSPGRRRAVSQRRHGRLRDQTYTTIRYPGGNFLSGYDWLNGVGPKDQRPRLRELAWQSWKPINLARTNLWSSVKRSMPRRCWGSTWAREPSSLPRSRGVLQCLARDEVV